MSYYFFVNLTFCSIASPISSLLRHSLSKKTCQRTPSIRAIIIENSIAFLCHSNRKSTIKFVSHALAIAQVTRLIAMFHLLVVFDRIIDRVPPSNHIAISTHIGRWFVATASVADVVALSASASQEIVIVDRLLFY